MSPRNLDPTLGFGFEAKLARGVLVMLPRLGAKKGGETRFQALPFQYNPETITRTRSGQWEHKENKKGAPPPQAKSKADGQRGGGLYAKSETINIKIVFDATELILRGATPGEDAAASPANGVLPELAVLERMALAKEQTDEEPKKTGEAQKLESLPPSELLLVLGPRRFPVVLNAVNIVEQRFTPALVPIRAEVDLRFRVLEVSENAADKLIGKTFDALMKAREDLSKAYPGADSETDAITGALGGHTGEGIT